MICWVESTTNDRLRQYIEDYGQRDGLSRFIREVSGTEGSVEDAAVSISSAATQSEQESRVAQHFNKIMRSRQKRLDAIKRDIKNTKDKAELGKLKGLKDNLTESISVLQGQMDAAKENANLEKLEQVAYTQLGWVNSMLERESLSPSEYQEMSNIIDLWENIRDVMFDRDEVITSGAMSVLSRIQNRVNDEDLRRKWHNSASNYLAHLGNYKDGQTLMEEFYRLNDLSFWKGYLLSTADTGNRLIGEMDRTIRNSFHRAELEKEQWKTRLKSSFDALRGKGLEGEFTHLSFQLKPDGSPTGNMTNEYAQMYWDSLAKASKNVTAAFAELSKNPDSATAKRKVKKAVKEKHKWLNENTVRVDTRFFADPKLVTEDGKSFATHKKQLVELLGEDKAKEAIEAARERYENFQEARENIKEGYKDELDTGLLIVPEGKTKEQHLESLMTEWDLRNNPNVWFTQGDASYTGAYTQQNNKWSYTLPRKYNNKGKETGYYDTNYSKIMGNPDMRNAFNLMNEFMDTMLSYVPSHMKRDIQSNFLPRFKEALVREYTLKDSLGAVSSLIGDWKDSLTSKGGTYKAEIDPTTGKPYKDPPLHGLTPVDLAERSQNLEKILALFGESAIKYKHKAETLDTVNMVHNFVNTMAKDTKRKEYTDDELTKMRKLLDYTTEALFFENNKKEEGVSNVRVFKGEAISVRDPAVEKEVFDTLNKLEKKMGTADAFKQLKEQYGDKVEIINKKKRWKEIQNRLADLQEELFEKKLTQEEYDERVEPLVAQAQTLGKRVVWSRLGDAGLKIVQAQAFWFNPFSAFNNYMFGVTSNAMWAHTGKDFTLGDFRKAFGLTFKSLLHIANKRTDKAANLIALYNILHESRDYKTQEGNETLRKIKNFPYVLLTKGDYLIKGQAFLAMMLSTKVTTKEGTQISLYDAYNEEGTWKSELFTEETNRDWSGDATSAEDMGAYLKFKNKADAIVKKLHGNFDPMSPMVHKEQFLGRALGQFRASWLSVGVQQRFAKREYDPYLERDVEGRYTTYADLGPFKSLSMLAKLAIGSPDALTGVRAQDKDVIEENMKKNLMEVYIYTVLFSIMLSLKHMSKGGEDDDYKYRLAYNMLWRVMGETTFYLSPQTALQILQDPLPVLQLTKKATGAFTGAMDLLFEDDLTDSERNRSIAKLTNTIPALNNVNKFMYATQRLR